MNVSAYPYEQLAWPEQLDAATKWNEKIVQVSGKDDPGRCFTSPFLPLRQSPSCESLLASNDSPVAGM